MSHSPDTKCHWFRKHERWFQIWGFRSMVLLYWKPDALWQTTHALKILVFRHQPRAEAHKLSFPTRSVAAQSCKTSRELRRHETEDYCLRKYIIWILGGLERCARIMSPGSHGCLAAWFFIIYRICGRHNKRWDVRMWYRYESNKEACTRRFYTSISLPRIWSLGQSPSRLEKYPELQTTLMCGKAGDKNATLWGKWLWYYTLHGLIGARRWWENQTC